MTGPEEVPKPADAVMARALCVRAVVDLLNTMADIHGFSARDLLRSVVERVGEKPHSQDGLGDVEHQEGAAVDQASLPARIMKDMNALQEFLRLKRVPHAPFAQSIGVHRTVIYKWFKGTNMPTLENLDKLKQILEPLGFKFTYDQPETK